MTEAAIAPSGAAAGLDLERVRADFPALDQSVHGHLLVYLDSAATALKPRPVIDAVVGVYERDCANIHRAVHLLSQRATEAYESARAKVAGFVGAASPQEILFVRGTTEALNLVAQTWGRSELGPGDEILITGLEHHSNIVPWQMLCEQNGAKLVVVPLADDGSVPLEWFEERLGERTRLVAIAHVSNALGTLLPVEEMARLAHACGAVVVVDGAQAAPHVPIGVGALGCDFYALSAHKMYGPTGIGALWGRRELLERMPPYQGGGDMIRSVTFARTTYNDVPHKFEAGTPNIAGAVGFGAAVDYVSGLGFRAVAAHERDLMAYATDALASAGDVRLVGTAPGKLAVVSFVMDAAHPHDVGTVLDAAGIAVRTGHHCAQPVMERYRLAATARASFGVYNTRADIDALVRGLDKVREMFA